MKKNIFNLSAITLVAMGTVFTGCQKDDIDAPVVTITGAASQTIFLQGTYTELNATANDEKDGAITPTISGVPPNVNLAGTYTLIYTATDAAGNVGTAERTIIVKNEVDAMTGTYQCTIPISGQPDYVYTQTVTASTTLNKRIGFSKFSGYAGNTNIYANIIGATVDLPSQTAIQVGSPAADRVFAGSAGSVVSATTFNITYTETTGGTTLNNVETFVKQ